MVIVRACGSVRENSIEPYSVESTGSRKVLSTGSNKYCGLGIISS